MKLYEGEQPCPGCGKTGREKPRRSKNHLCFNCESDLRLGKQIGDYYGRKYEIAVVRDLIKCDIGYNSISYVFHKLIIFLRTVSNFSFSFAVTQDGKIQDLLENVEKRPESYSFEKIVLPLETIEAAKDLCKSLYEKTEELNKKEKLMNFEMREQLASERDKIYNEGIKHGRNLLMQLNNGEIGENDFFKEYHYKEGGGK